MTDLDIYKHHAANSKAGELHRVFDEQGTAETRRRAEEYNLPTDLVDQWITLWFGGEAKLPYTISMDPTISEMLDDMARHYKLSRAEIVRRLIFNEHAAMHGDHGYRGGAAYGEIGV